MDRALLRLMVAFVFCSTLAPAAAKAQPTPSFKYSDKPAKSASGVQWDAQAGAGVIVTTGNSRQTIVTGSTKAVRTSGFNKLQAELAGNVARTSVTVARDANANGTVDGDNEIAHETRVTAQSIELKGRYDRFLTDNNSLYLTALAATDEPAGKELVGGAQTGYSRQLIKSDTHELLAEAGYDLTYESLIASDKALAIHSGRVFAGYKGKVSSTTGVSASAELLLNFNTLDAPGGQVGPLEDARLTSKAELVTKISEGINLSVSVIAKLDNAPAPRPAIGLPYADGFVPLADTLDTTTKLTLIVNLL